MTSEKKSRTSENSSKNITEDEAKKYSILDVTPSIKRRIEEEERTTLLKYIEDSSSSSKSETTKLLETKG
ncbi:hypothetical protein JTB14_023232 [Gonioctena quinquepunctata]|nr:hypothetical protein JTB14_023232 [Gonioctena quinquepunctata]